jgi:hypothetical protein
MGFFSKRQAGPSLASRTEPVSLPITVVEEDFANCASALGKMEEALLGGNDGGIRSAAREIAWAGGTRPDGDFAQWSVKQVMENTGHDSNRPWWWLAEVAERASSRGDARLAGRVGFFANSWYENVSPKMGLADDLDCWGLKTVPREAYAKGLGHAVIALSPLSPDEKIVETSQQFVPVQTLRPALANALLQLNQAGVSVTPEAKAAALQMVA